MSSLPDQCGVAFKEWAGVCQALAEGRQTLIVRKGGISEGPGGFTPQHHVFWLYPTHVHQAQQGLREEGADWPHGPAPEPTNRVPIRALAVVELVRHIDSEAELLALAPFHVWTLETIRKRFSYRQPGLWALGVRVFHRAEPWTFVPTAEQLGCKSWVILEPALPTNDLRPALDDDAWTQQIRLLRSTLAPDTGTGPRGSPA